MLKRDANQPEFVDFYLPFGGKLRAENRWVKLARLIPWEAVEERYAEAMSVVGRQGLSARIALGSLVIKERLGTTDRETVEQIRENPYLQYFLGYREYRDEVPFDASMLVHFRRRLPLEAWQELNEALVERAQERLAAQEDSDDGEPPEPPSGAADAAPARSSEQPPSPPSDTRRRSREEPPPPRRAGKLIIDATASPCDIRHPTELGLVNEAREKTERILDLLYDSCREQVAEKPRTYRQKARRRFAKVARQKKARVKAVRKELRWQLNCVDRNLRSINDLLAHTTLAVLPPRLFEQLQTILAIHREQRRRLKAPQHFPQTIYSLSQPHVRAIYRGKASHSYEFGPKFSLSVAHGFAFVDRLQWTPYNESADLFDQLDAFERRFGCPPESIHADRIYHTRHNRRICKLSRVRLSAPPLGRPGPDAAEQRRQLARDEADRNAVEGKIGQLKRRFSLNRLMGKLKTTCESIIGCAVFCANLAHCEALGLPALLQRLIAMLSPALQTTRLPAPPTSPCRMAA